MKTILKITLKLNYNIHIKIPKNILKQKKTTITYNTHNLHLKKPIIHIYITNHTLNSITIKYKPNLIKNYQHTLPPYNNNNSKKILTHSKS